MSWGQERDDNDKDDMVPRDTKEVDRFRYVDDSGVQDCSSGFRGVSSATTATGVHEQEHDLAPSSTLRTSEGVSPVMVPCSRDTSPFPTKTLGYCDDGVLDDGSDGIVVARSPEGVIPIGSAMHRDVFDAAPNSRQREVSFEEMVPVPTMGAVADGTVGQGVTSCRALSGSATMVTERHTQRARQMKQDLVSYCAPSVEFNSLGGTTLSCGIRSSSVPGKVGHGSLEADSSGATESSKFSLKNAPKCERTETTMQAGAVLHPTPVMSSPVYSAEVETQLTIEELLGISTSRDLWRRRRDCSCVREPL